VSNEAERSTKEMLKLFKSLGSLKTICGLTRSSISNMVGTEATLVRGTVEKKGRCRR
jgi:hypothetical protein